MPRFDFPPSHPFHAVLRRDADLFPARIEELVRRIAAIDEEQLVPFMGSAFDWEAGRQLERGEEELRQRLVLLWKGGGRAGADDGV